MPQQTQPAPIKIVGGNNFGRYPKISVEQTFNMIVSDQFLVDVAGYKNVLTVAGNSKGRGIYSSLRANLIIAVWGSQLYTISPNLVATFRGNLSTNQGDVFIAENNNGEIAITDLNKLYVFNYLNLSFQESVPESSPTIPGVTFTVPFNSPGYISFQNGRLIVVDTSYNTWYLSGFNNATDWTSASNRVGALQTKPDTAVAAVPMPGGGNNLMVFGHSVIEQWQDVGAAKFPYQRNSTFNVDYGCLNASSISALDNYIVWLGANEQSGATLMVYSGQKVVSISTDGMDFKFASLSNPSNCTGFLFRQDGHLLYQFTFPDDNLSYLYDFNTKLFFTVTDESLNYHIARNVVFFDNNYYFVSLNGGNLYQLSTDITNFQYSETNIKEIPRIRITPPFRRPDSLPFVGNTLVFTVENGQRNQETVTQYFEDNDDYLCAEGDDELLTEGGEHLVIEGQGSELYNTITTYTEAIDLSMSKDGGENFGNYSRLYMNPSGKRKSIVRFRNLGRANDLSFQIAFWGKGRFVVTDGLLDFY